MFRSP
jgi:hypothetical protein